MRKNRSLIIFVLIGIAFIFSVSIVNASTNFSSHKNNLRQSYKTCESCHSRNNFYGVLLDGSEVSLTVPDEFGIHNQEDVECTSCHDTYSGYPHREEYQLTCSTCHGEYDSILVVKFDELKPTLPYENLRDLKTSLSPSCENCHDEEAIKSQDSIHNDVLASGNLEAPVCVDCHGGHSVSTPNEPRAKISETCSTCHKAIYSSYKISVHGEALEIESNPDVPTCINCHGVHEIHGPHDSGFRNESIAICGDCHQNESLMSKYGISTDVFQTYIDDFHGRTVNLFRVTGDTIPSNKAVCYDCHGIHNILSPDDPLSQVYPDNLQKTCQKCHEDANIEFPSAWLSHYTPTIETSPVLYIVNLIYPIFVGLTMGFLSIYVVLDARKRLSDKKSKSDEATNNE